MKLANSRNTLTASLFPAPSHYLRLWDGGTRMSLLNPGPGVFNWTRLDAHLAASAAAGIPTIYTFGSTPAWAAVPPMGGAAGSAWPDNPTGNYPMDLAALEAFVTALLAHTGTQISVFETWNEWNASNFYAGTLDQLVAMHFVIYTAVKKCNPKALVTTPTPCWFPSGKFPTVDVAQNAFFRIGAPFDVVTMHGYLQNGAPAGQIAPVIQKLQSVLAANAVSAPLWDTEFGPNSPANIAPDQQRLWVFDALVTRQKLGLDLACWYQWDNQTHGAMVDLAGNLTTMGQAWSDYFAAQKFEAQG
jgi:hypothetical protein